jgi:hypothetical protein
VQLFLLSISAEHMSLQEIHVAAKYINKKLLRAKVGDAGANMNTHFKLTEEKQ